MNVLKAPRAVAATEYFLLRLPLTAVHRGVLEPRLDSASPLLLGFERVIGRLDMAAGTLLGDPALHRRGTALARKAQATGLARDLEDKADRRAETAEAKLERERREADERREAARAEAELTADAVEADRRARKAAAEREAAAKVSSVAAATRRQAQAEREAGHVAAKNNVTRIRAARRGSGRGARSAAQERRPDRQVRGRQARRGRPTRGTRGGGEGEAQAPLSRPCPQGAVRASVPEFLTPRPRAWPGPRRVRC